MMLQSIWQHCNSEIRRIGLLRVDQKILNLSVVGNFQSLMLEMPLQH